MLFNDMSPPSAATAGNGALAAMMMMQQQYPFPVSAATGPAPSAPALAALSAERRLAAELGAHASMTVPAALAVATPQQAVLQRAMMMPHAFFAGGGVAGTAFEHGTLLGRVLRAVSIDPNDPQIVALFRDAHKQPRNIIESRINEFRSRQAIAHGQVADIVLRLLKQKKCKDRAMLWLRQGVALNLEAGKERPSPFVASSKGFMLNFGSVMLRICRPFMNDLEKIRKIDWRFLIDSGSQDVFPSNGTQLTTAIPKDLVSFDIARREDSSGREYNFLTSSFFLTLRALSLGAVQECIRYPNVLRGLSRYRDGLDTGSREAVHYLVNKVASDINMAAPDLIKDLLGFATTVCSWMLLNLPDAVSAPSGDSTNRSLGEWIVNMDPNVSSNVESYRFLSSLPDYVVSDVCEILLFVAKLDSSHFCSTDLQSVLAVIVYFLRRPWIITSPHLRAKLGQVLFYVFLPSSERDNSVEHYTGIKGRDGPQVYLLERDRECVAYLAPALLLLYGDVERTGFYEKLTNRRAIMVVLQFLWKQASHRPAFRGIVGASSPSESDVHRVNFIKFANGLLNETNALVSSVMDKLQEIRATQIQMGSGQEWSSLAAETRSQITDRHAENEMEVRFKATLCIQTMNMLNYLTSDEIIRQPFLLDEILPRFTSMLLNVVAKLSGPKSLEIKVDNMESYNFEPKRMLSEVCSAMIHFADCEAFWRSMSQDGFFENGVPLSKAAAVLSKFNLLPPADVAAFEQMVSRAKDARSSYHNLEALADSAPPEFLDPLLSTIMKDPVLLPTSNHIVDRATIYQHLLNDEKDPFNRMPLTVGMLVPQEELKSRIYKWLAENGVHI
jgi:ubiquitin conjugation factor E4 B